MVNIGRKILYDKVIWRVKLFKVVLSNKNKHFIPPQISLILFRLLSLYSLLKLKDDQEKESFSCILVKWVSKQIGQQQKNPLTLHERILEIGEPKFPPFRKLSSCRLGTKRQTTAIFHNSGGWFSLFQAFVFVFFDRFRNNQRGLLYIFVVGKGKEKT